MKDNIFYTIQLPGGKISEKKISIETNLLIEAAERKGATWRIIPFSEVIEFKINRKIVYLWDRSFDNTTYTGYRFCINKDITKKLLNEKNISICPGYLIAKDEKCNISLLENIFSSLQKPLVLKLSHGSHGDGVVMGIDNLEKFKIVIEQLFNISHKEDEGIIAEESFFGKEYRILVSREKVLGIMHRIPANVIGDGEKTIKQLIEVKNIDPLRNIDHYLYPKISLDDEMIKILEEQNLTPNSIPQLNKIISLRKVSNIMAGGDAVDYTDIAHPSVNEVALQIINAIPGIPFVGIDFMTKDITQPQTKETYRVIEVNGTPEFAMHDIPMIGKSRNVSDAIVEIAFRE